SFSLSLSPQHLTVHTFPTRRSSDLKCHGARLKDEYLSVKINGLNIAEVTDMPISESYEWFNNLKLNESEKIIAEEVLKEIKERLKFLKDVGLEYLTLSRSSGTLSGGESQRIRLATQIGSDR